jgi:pyruvate ferredoxin oxidoreductase alpha subunit
MPELMEGSQAVARTVARCRPAVVCAYPISPQTHIVEALSGFVRTGVLRDCEYLNVESEFAAMSVAIGSSAAGARTYTATASQGLLYMAEAVFNASGLQLPIVMTMANRAIGAPINIWNDQSDSLALRDSGWLQIYAADNQEAADMHVIGFKLAEELSMPVMVCMDGFVLTHASDVVELPTQEAVDAFLPSYRPRAALDIEQPTTVGMMSGPDTFTEVKYIQHRAMIEALPVLDRIVGEFAEAFGRSSGTLVRQFAPAADGDVVVVAMGSVIGTLRVVIDALRQDGRPIRLVGLGAFRPFPAQRLHQAIAGASRVVVIDRALELGSQGVLTGEIHRALADVVDTPPVHSVLAGLGGRPMTEVSLAAVLTDACAGHLEATTFLDLNVAAVGAK